MIDKLKIWGQYLLPKHLLSRLVGSLAAAQAGAVTTKLIEVFANHFKVDMSEAQQPDLKQYKTFNDFFTRSLADGVRPLTEGEKSVAHPVDGTISQLGPIRHGRVIQAKSHDYSTCELLGGDRLLANEFEDGDFATIYLSPKDYHRIHMPVTGTLRQMIYVPGDLFSVNPLTAENVPNLFARNERVVAIFDTELGPMALVLVGATIVASIETVWAGTVTPPAGKRVIRWDYRGDDAIVLEKGAEMGRFKLGSTVVALFGKDALEFAEGLEAGTTTRMGELFARQK